MNLVQSYGGNYLASPEDLIRIAEYVTENRSRYDGLVIVTAGSAKRAENLARELEKAGTGARFIDNVRGESLDIVELERGKHEIMLDGILDAFRENLVAVIPGSRVFVAPEFSEFPGQYGAATTAVAIAGGLGCECELYGSSKGIYVVDPRVTESSAVFRQISHEEAMELTALGSGDLEAGAIELAKTLGVTVYVGPAFNMNRTGGTYIVDRSVIVQEAAVSGISVSDDIVIYTIRNIVTTGDAVSELFEMLGDLGVNVDVISQQPSSGNTGTISFSCNEDSMDDIDKALESNSRFCNLEVSRQTGICLISLVGVGMATHVGVAGKTFATLAQHGIQQYNITTSEISISAAIDSDRKTEAAVALSEAFSL